MKCIILCAGYGTRLYPLTKNKPKALLKVNGKYILDYLLDDLSKNKNIDKFYIITNNKFYFNFEKYKKNRNENIVLINDLTNSNEERLGAVKDLKVVLDKYSINDDMLIMASDNILKFSINEFIKYFYEVNTSIVMYYKETDFNKLSRTGVAVVDEDNNIVAMKEKPKEFISNNALPPFYIFKKEEEEILRKNLNIIKKDSLGFIIEEHIKYCKMKGYLMNEKRIDIGNLEDYKKLSRNNT